MIWFTIIGYNHDDDDVTVVVVHTKRFFFFLHLDMDEDVLGQNISAALLYFIIVLFGLHILPLY